MFDIGAQEILLILVVAVLVIGPKDMPAALRAAGRWIGKMRRMSGHFRSGLDSMIREAEMEDMEKKWKAQNEKVMREHPDGGPEEMEQTGAYPAAKSTPPATPASTQPATPAAPPATKPGAQKLSDVANAESAAGGRAPAAGKPSEPDDGKAE